jgi:uncharacterized protein YijF (DUF1287 family)
MVEKLQNEIKSFEGKIVHNPGDGLMPDKILFNYARVYGAFMYMMTCNAKSL